MIAMALAALLQAAHPAAPPPGAAVPMSPQQQMEAMTNMLRARGMSDRGIAAIQAGVRNGQSLVQAAIPKLQASAAAMRGSAIAKPFDRAAFEQALRAQSALAAQFKAQQTEHQISILRSLSTGDQQIYAELLVRQPPPAR